MSFISTIVTLFAIYLFISYKVFPLGTVETFETPQPPPLPEKTLHWGHNYAEKAQLKDDVIHVDLLVNAFPMQKPPSTWEKTMEGAQDVARSDFLPHMRKRGETM